MQGISKKSNGPAGGYSQFDTIAMRFRVSVVTISVTISNAAGLRVSFAAKGSVSWLVSHSAIVFPLLSIHCRLHLSACMIPTPGLQAHLKPLWRVYSPLVLFGILRVEVT